jgi:hypothetical protein
VVFLKSFYNKSHFLPYRILLSSRGFTTNSLNERQYSTNEREYGDEPLGSGATELVVS